MTNSPPWLPFHVGDYLKETPPFNRATWILHALYLHAQTLMWISAYCRIPNDVAWIARQFGCTIKECEKYVLPVLRAHFKCNGNWWTHPRLNKEWKRVRDQSRLQGERANKRWNNKKALCRGIDPAMPKAGSGIAPTPNPTPTPNNNKYTKKLGSEASQAEASAFDAFWHLCPLKVGKAKARTAYREALEKTSPETLEAAMRNYATSRVGQDETFTVHPATWLNDERWLDEATHSNAGQVKNLAVAALEATAEAEDENLKRWGLK